MDRRSFIKSAVVLGLSIKSSIVGGSIYLKERLNRIVSIDISSESTEGGEIKCYLDSDNLVKIEKSQYWESGRQFVTYILNKEHILIVKERIERYNVPFYVNKELAKEIGSDEYFDFEKSTIINSTYYFKDDCVSYISNSSDNSGCFNDLADATKVFITELDDINRKLNSKHVVS